MADLEGRPNPRELQLRSLSLEDMLPYFKYGYHLLIQSHELIYQYGGAEDPTLDDEEWSQISEMHSRSEILWRDAKYHQRIQELNFSSFFIF
ncbi:hypothetical protein LOK49_Contig755G00002 [Camellia lanceoleosa]|nr:hypothetical protein LOK49_Contig755G00002 [Camellia lanceoleosa]